MPESVRKQQAGAASSLVRGAQRVRAALITRAIEVTPTFATFLRLVRRNPYPRRTITADATLIEHLVPTRQSRKVTSTFVIARGSIQQNAVAVSEQSLHPTILDMFVNGKHYRSTEQYATMSRAVQLYLDGGTEQPSKHGAYWCKSHRDVDQYFGNLIAAYQSIRRSGYRSQVELAALARQSDSRVRVRSSLRDELEVFVGGDGSLVFSGRGANHRFSMVKLLGLQSVPVVLGGVDEDYLANHHGAMPWTFEQLYVAIVDGHGGLSFR